jgi:hypothetical protein
MRKILFPFLIFFLFGCSSNHPRDILSASKMQAVMWDLARADELADYKAIKDTSMNKWTNHAVYYQQILQIHQVSQEQFKKSMQYYQSHPTELQAIIDSLQVRAERQKRGEPQQPSYPTDSARLRKRLAP